MKDDKATKAFSFFLSNVGEIVTVEDIMEATGWAKATVTTYISKKWSIFLEEKKDFEVSDKSGRKITRAIRKYKVTEKFKEFELNDFLQLQTQKINKKNYSHLDSIIAPKVSDDEHTIENAYINYLSIKNFVCFRQVELQNLAKSKEIYFLGENGDGKTLLLQAILITLKRHFLNKKVSKEFLGKVIDLFPEIELFENNNLNFSKKTSKSNNNLDFFEKKSVLSAVDDQDKKYNLQNHCYVKNIYAYGVHRSHNESADIEPYGFSSLFSNSVALQQPDDWLKNIHGQELEKQREESGENTISLSTVITLLKEILSNNLDIQVSFKDGVKYIERGTEISFDLLSEGYKSVLIWVIDLLSRLVENQPYVEKIQDFVGIVLVDEINLHLHPKWEYDLVKKLRQWFPKIQFIFTTHSPITILGASKDAVFYRLYKENGETKVSEPYTASQLQPLMANSIITSPLFDLDTARMRIFNQQEAELDTSESYLDSRIHAEVDKQIKALKQAGKIYISSEEIDELVQQAIEKLQEE